ncbi:MULTISPECIES: hypothetical protein [Aliivibrio]|uniref:Uncharacterized protein n=1 Tax=Aliivibrio finisterrensis TaxID=511998 RepID=A0A4Q5KYJ3_9GAMM|nr:MULTISPECIES: hypothetical protein [Aliivibrio]MDD9178367.1 hypothetical protein [Aliivibrio sp. A6]RYU54932.1 hypothetical protein ERW57_01440 [Aliivibrio finisterrensis]RYU56608.1 hypothetical protein ERW56_01120 [Aliivibrio finisterrensis]RYU61729.1 hypothetical protein ERW50_01120 [Aliivibrio finisterrensis]RYU66558.1 hypothetical protein ERW53_02555 [Aliivibrio finisterrensis]
MENKTTKILSVRRSSLMKKSSPEEYFDSKSQTASDLKEKIKQARLAMKQSVDEESELAKAFSI